MDSQRSRRPFLTASHLCATALAVLLFGCAPDPAEVAGPVDVAFGRGNGNGGGPPGGQDPALTFVLRDAASDSIRSDGDSAYTDGECGVSAAFNLGDGILRLQSIKKKDQGGCGGVAQRHFVVRGFPSGSPGGPERLGTFLTVEDLELGGDPTTPGFTDLGMSVEGCPMNLRMDASLDLDGNGIPDADDVIVEASGPGAWTVRSLPAPDNRAVCIAADTVKFTVHLDFEITVLEQS